MISPSDDRRFVDGLSNFIVIHFSEFDKFYTHKNLAMIKSATTSSKRPVYKYYGKHIDQITLRGSIVGTTNVSIENFLKDPTGNRRVWYLDIEKITWKYPVGESMQVMAQAQCIADAYRCTAINLNNIKLMNQYIECHKPQSMAEKVCEAYDGRISELMVQLESEKLKYDQVKPLLVEIASEFDVTLNKVSEYLKDRKQHTREGNIYTKLQ
jgi:hypothetical protein